jgi:hypothetical protein
VNKTRKDQTTREAELVEAFIRGIHVHQVLLAGRTGRGDAHCFSPSALSPEELATLDSTGAHLFRLSGRDLDQWVEAGAGPAAQLVADLLSAPVTLSPRLPVSVIASHLAEEAPTQPGASVRALASLFQLTLEVDRDAQEIQDLFRIYTTAPAFGGHPLPVCFQDLGLDYGPGDLDGLAKELAEQSCAAPYDTLERAWRLALEKVRFWGEKYSGRITADTYAQELLAGELKGVVRALRTLPPMKVCVLGHSFSYPIHWSSHGVFPAIVEAVFKRANPGVTFSYVNEGGLQAARAREVYLPQALATKPDLVLLVLRIETEADHQALGEMITSTRAAGSRAVLFDRLIPKGRPFYTDPTGAVRIALEAGGEVIFAGDLIDHHPDREQFLSLDGVHMGPPYHKFMAGLLLRHLAPSPRPSPTGRGKR